MTASGPPSVRRQWLRVAVASPSRVGTSAVSMTFPSGAPRVRRRLARRPCLASPSLPPRLPAHGGRSWGLRWHNSPYGINAATVREVPPRLVWAGVHANPRPGPRARRGETLKTSGESGKRAGVLPYRSSGRVSYAGAMSRISNSTPSPRQSRWSEKTISTSPSSSASAWRKAMPRHVAGPSLTATLR